MDKHREEIISAETHWARSHGKVHGRVKNEYLYFGRWPWRGAEESVDVRRASQYSQGHIPKSLCVGLHLAWVLY